MEIPHRVFHHWVVVHTYVKAIERPGSGHVVLAVEHLFCGATENPESAGDLLLLHVILERNGGANRGGADQVMTAAVAVGVTAFRGCLLGYGVIAQPRERVELHQDAQDRGPTSPGGDPGGVEAADPPVADLEPVLFQDFGFIGLSS